MINKEALAFSLFLLCATIIVVCYIPPTLFTGEIEIEAYDIRKEIAIKYSQANAEAVKTGKSFGLSQKPFTDYFPVYIVIRNNIKWKIYVSDFDFDLITSTKKIAYRTPESNNFKNYAPYMQYKEFDGGDVRPGQTLEGVMLFEKHFELENPVALIFESKSVSPKKFKKIIKIVENK